jgi:hypothetical protein
MWMELGLLGAVGLLPVIVVVAIFQAANLRRARKIGPSPDRNWLSSSELRGPDQVLQSTGADLHRLSRRSPGEQRDIYPV